VTFIIMNVLKLVLGGVRYKDEVLEVGDLAIHGEEAFPEDSFASRVGITVPGEEFENEPPLPDDPVPSGGTGS
jgi:hypothetical protein